MLTPLLAALWVCGCALALCCYVGWGAARLALPASLRPSGALWAPLVGYAMVLWAGYLGVSSALNLRWSLGLLLAAASALNLLAWRRGGGPRPSRPGPAALALALLLGLALLAGLWPLLRYGYLTAIGQGWDTESYWPMAQHLTDYPLARIPEAPFSPLRNLVLSPPRIGLTLGFSVIQGMTMLLSGQSAIATFAPLLALLRALGLLAVYAWLRACMGLRAPAALLGTALAGAGALLLWIGYFNFGMQMSAWPLLALGLALGLASVEELAERGAAAWPAALLGAATLAALPVAYYPALTIWVPMAAGLGAARLLEAWRRPAGPALRECGRLALAAAALGALALLLAAPTVRDYYQGFSFRYSLPEPKIGPERFIAATETLGLTAFRLPGGGAQPPAPLVLLASLLAGALALAGLALSDQRPTTNNQHPDEGRRTKDEGATSDQRPATSDQRGNSLFFVLGSRFSVLGSWFSALGSRLSGPRLRWLAVCAGVLAYLVWLRYGRPYQYGYMKGSAYAGFVGWGLVALGAQSLAARVTGRARALVAGLALVPLLAAGWAQALIIGEHSGGPAIFTRDLVAFEQAAAQIPPGATVQISNDETLIGPNSGLLATALYGRTIWGHIDTAYGGADVWPEGQMPQYAVLAAREQPWPLELGGRELWRSRALALYRLDPGRAVLLARAGQYLGDTAGGQNKPAGLALWRRAGPYRSAEPGAPLRLYVGERLAFAPQAADTRGGPRTLTLTLASLRPQRVTVQAGTTVQQIDIPGGVSAVTLPVRAPTAVTVSAETTVALIQASARAEDDSALVVQPAPDQIAWRPEVERDGDTLRVRVATANPHRHALRASLTVVENSFFQAQRLARLLGALPVDGGWEVSVDLARGATEARVDGRPVPLLSAETASEPPDSSYFAVLTLYDGEEPVLSAPLATFRIDGGHIADFQAETFSVERAPAGLPSGPLPGSLRRLMPPAGRLDAGGLELRGALLARQPARPGDPPDAPLSAGESFGARLFWRAERPPDRPLMVSLQVVDADNHKWAQWDGPVGGAWRPLTGWGPAEQVRQDVPLALDPATPPGRYRLQMVVYDPSDGRPLPFGGEQSLGLGELEVR